MRVAKAIAAGAMCACMMVGLSACDGSDAQAEGGAGEQATEETSAEEAQAAADESAAAAGEAASDAASAGEGEGSQQEDGSEAADSGSTEASSASESNQNASSGSNGGASASSAKASGSASAQASTASATSSSAPAHTHSYTIPITSQVWHEPVYKGVTMCGLCGCEETSSAHGEAHILNGEYGYYGYVKDVLVSDGYYETVTTGYKCSCGAVK